MTSVLLLVMTSPCVLPSAVDPVSRAVAPFFRAFETELATLSPDGRTVAFDIFDQSGSGVVVFDLTDQTSRRIVVSKERDPDGRVARLLWITPERLVLATHGQTIGSIDLTTGATVVWLRSADLSSFAPQPRLSPRRMSAGVTANVPGGGQRPLVGGADAQSPLEVEWDSPQLRSLVPGDLFGPEAKRVAPLALTTALVGRAGDAPGAAVLVEVRSALSLFENVKTGRQTIVVPSNVVVVESGSAPPDEAPALLVSGGGFASYDIIRPPAAFVALAFDPASGERRVVAERPGWRRVLYDRQGRPRIALDDQEDRRVFLHREPDAKRWIPLTKLVAAGEPFAFIMTPATLLGPRSVPLGFDASGRLLYVASSVGTDTFALRALDTTTWRATELEVAHEQFDLIEPWSLWSEDVLVFDPHGSELIGVRFAPGQRGTLWFDDEIGQLQVALTKKFAPRRCEIREWDRTRTRWLLEVSGPAEPGGFYIYHRDTNGIEGVAMRAPWLGVDRVNEAHEFAFDLPEGRRLSGTIVLPRAPRLDPAPVLVYFHDGPWLSDPPVFNRGAQALADLGFAVVQLNYRGSGGFGRRHLDAIKAGYDRVVLEDVRAVLTRAGATLPINPQMAAALGNGFGGYLALRAVQLEPAVFRCAVAINTPADLEAWCKSRGPGTFRDEVRREFFGNDKAALQAASALAAAPATTRPVLVVHASEDAEVPFAMGRKLYAALRQGNDSTAFLELPGEGHAGWSRVATERLFAELGKFFNATVYRYSVELGPATTEP